MMLPVSPVPPSPLLMSPQEAWSVMLLGPFALGLAMILLLITLKIGDDGDDDET